jgi:hypothetical protein
MAINFNGTTLATNIDAVVFNGTAVTKVMFNGTEVWAKMANLAWSGNSLISGNRGIEVSGNLFRAVGSGAQGAWITAQSNGTFTGDSSTENVYQGMSLSVSGNLVRTKMAGEPAGAWVTYTVANKAFTGESRSGYYSQSSYNNFYFLQTSGGLIRFHQILYQSAASGAYISLK